MEASQIPVKIGVPFGSSAGGSYITSPIPVPSQIGISNGRASFTDGFPPWGFQPGGYPWGEDFNGILNMITLWNQWQNAGAPIYYDAAFSTAIGGYPQYALIASVSVPGAWWQSQVDNNTSDPDTGGANWVLCTMQQPYLDARYLRLPPATTFYVSPTGSNSNNGLTTGTAWATLTYAIAQIQQYALNGLTVTIQLTTPATYGYPTAAIRAPGAGTLVIQGDPANQSAYVISGVGIASVGVISGLGGNLSLVGVTVQNTGTQAHNIVSQNGGSVSLTNVTCATSVVNLFSLALSSLSGSITVESGCIMNGGCASAFLASGGTITMGADIAFADTPHFSVATVTCTNNGVFAIGSSSLGFTGSGCTGSRYYGLLGGIINTAGLGGNATIPGSSNGSIIAPGGIDVA